MFKRRRFFFFAPDGASGGSTGGTSGSAGDGSKSGDGGGGGNGAGADEGEKPIYTKSQYESILKEKIAQQKRSLEQEFEKKYGINREEVTEFQKWKTEQAKLEQKRKEEQGKFAELMEENRKTFQAELSKRDDEYKTLRNRYQSAQVKNTIAILAGEMGIINPEEVFLLVQKHFRIRDDDSIEVLGEDGTTAFGKDGKPHSPKSFLSDWLSSRPYFVRGSGGGSGTPGAGRTGGSAGGKTYLRSQLRDSKFYEANKEDIAKALREGRILDDTKNQ